MRRAARLDANQQEIVRALRQCGASVQSLASLGGGVPDLLVFKGGKYLLMEIKDGSKPPSKRQLTPDQESWRKAWGGPVAVVTSVDEAIGAVS